MDALEYIALDCPYCGQLNEISVERTGQAQSYAEDCQLCCRAMQLDITELDGEIQISACREDD